MPSFTRNDKSAKVIPLPERKKHPGLWRMLHTMANALPSRNRPMQRPNPFQPARPLPGVVPEGKPKVPQIAMDAAEMYKKLAQDGFNKLAQDEYDGGISSGGGWIAGSGQGYYGSAYAEGQEWLGYAVLALLAQRPEYRIMTDTLATEMTREWIVFESRSGDKKMKERVDKLEERLRELKLQAVMKAANVNDGFQGRGQVYIDTGKPDDRAELKLPLDPSTQEGRKAIQAKYGSKGKFITGIRAIEPMWCYPAAYEASDPLRADWYKPEMWWVMGKEVSRHRLLCFVGNEVPDLIKPAYSFGGIAMSQMAKPYVDFWLRNRTSESDLLNNFSIPVLATDLDVTTADEGSELFQRALTFNLVRDNQGLMLINKDSEEFNIRQTSLGGVDAITRQSMERLTIPSRMPIVKFFGNQPSGLNADSEGVIRMWYDDVRAAQESRNRDIIQTISQLCQIELFGEVIDDIKFEFKALWQLDDAGKAAVQLTRAQIIETDISSGVIDPNEGRAARAADEDSPYQEMDLSGEAPGMKMQEEQEQGGEGGEGTGLIKPKDQPGVAEKLQRGVESQSSQFGGAASGFDEE
jgi:phage-related protein (TIGR01555 family)